MGHAYPLSPCWHVCPSDTRKQMAPWEAGRTQFRKLCSSCGEGPFVYCCFSGYSIMSDSRDFLGRKDLERVEPRSPLSQSLPKVLGSVTGEKMALSCSIMFRQFSARKAGPPRILLVIPTLQFTPGIAFLLEHSVSLKTQNKILSKSNNSPWVSGNVIIFSPVLCPCHVRVF